MNLNPKKTTNSNTGRNLHADLLKGIAVLMMVQVHITELFSNTMWQNSLAGKWSLFLGGSPAAPVFMVLMGFYAFSSKPTFISQIIRGLRLILYGFLLNLGLNFHLIIRLLTKQIALNIWPYIFGVDIFFLAGLSLILIAVAKRVIGDRLVYWILMFIVLGLSNQIIPAYNGQIQWVRYLQAYFYGNQTWSYFPFFPWGAYPVAGVISSILSEKFLISKVTEQQWISVFIVLTSLLIATFIYGFDAVSNLQRYYHHNGLLVLWNLAFVLWEVALMRLIINPEYHSKVLRWLAWAGKHVTPFYVFQWLIIGNLATWFYQSLFPLQLLIIFLITLVMSSFLTLQWIKLKQKIRTLDKRQLQR